MNANKRERKKNDEEKMLVNSKEKKTYFGRLSDIFELKYNKNIDTSFKNIQYTYIVAILYGLLSRLG